MTNNAKWREVCIREYDRLVAAGAPPDDTTWELAAYHVWERSVVPVLDRPR